MKIPVFVSCPTTLNQKQEDAKKMILHELDRLDLEPRALGVSDFATQFPLREVCVLAKRCSGGIILGFEQFCSTSGIRKAGTPKEAIVNGKLSFPTEWNNLESGILFSIGLPLLVFKENGIGGGIFDIGVSDVFLYDMPIPSLPDSEKKQFAAVILKWQAKVREHYYHE
jgi:hypothetical protein